MLPALQGPAGTYAQWAKGSNNSFHLTRNAAENPEKARAIMRFLNDAMDPSSETYRTLIFGRPGEDYEVRDGKPYARTGNQPGWLSYYANTRIGNDEYWNVSWQKLFPDLPGKLKFSGSQPVLPHVTPLVAAPDAMPDLMNYVREMHAKFAVGDESLDTWDAFVETAMTQYSGQSVIEDVTAQLTELGLTK
jgi:hypothetical protein